MMNSPTLADLDGEVSELRALEAVARACECTIVPGPGQKFGWLSGTSLDAATTPQEVRARASDKLVLNGLARLQTRNIACRAAEQDDEIAPSYT
jgi:hypothetical protein